MSEVRQILQDVTRDLRDIYKRLSEVELTGVPDTSGTVPGAGTQYNHLEDSGANWISVTNLTMADNASIGHAGARLRFDDTNDELDVLLNGAIDFVFKVNELSVEAGSWISETGIRATLANAEGLYVPWVTGDADATSRFGSTNAANNQIAVEAYSYSSIGCNGISITSSGVFGSSSSGIGVQGSSVSGAGARFSSGTDIGLVVNLTGAGTAIADFNDNGVSVLTIQDGGQSDFAEYIRHLSDTDTSMRFQADQWTLDCGGVTMIDAVEGASDYVHIPVDTGVGVVPTVRLDVRDTAFPVLGITRVTTATNSFASGARLTTESTGNATDGFGGGFVFGISDTGVTNSLLASIGAVRSGADNSGMLQLNTYNAGAFQQGQMVILPAGDVGIGTTSPGSLTEWNFATEDLEFVDAGSAGATEQDWIEVQVGGVTGYIRVYAAV